MPDDGDGEPRERCPDVRAEIECVFRAERAGELALLIGQTLAERAGVDVEEMFGRAKANDAQIRHNARHAGRRPQSRDNIVTMLRGEIAAGRITLAELQQYPAKFAELYGFHHATFAAAIAVLVQE